MLYTAKKSTEQSDRQRLHDKEMKKIDRDMTFRKEIYVEATEAFMIASMTISRLPDLDVSKKDIAQPLLVKISAYAKANIIAGEQLFRAMANFMAEFTQSFSYLMPMRDELDVIVQEAKLLDKVVRDLVSSIDDLLRRIKDEAIKPDLRQGTLDALTQLHEIYTKSHRTRSEELERVNIKLKSKHHPFIRVCSGASHRLAPLAMEALLEARKELEFSGDEQAFRKIANEMLAKLPSLS